jgi:hypothetical protein
MAQTPTPGNHSAQNYSPWNRYKTPATTTWGSTANTCTITDPKATTNSAVLVWVTGTTPAAGRWSISTATVGSIIITSTDAESSTLPISYILL